MAGNNELIQSTIRDLKKESDDIESQIHDICYHMNGGVTWNEAWAMSYDSRISMVKRITKRLEKMDGKEYM